MQTVVIWVVSCIAIALVGLLVGACWMTMPFAALPQVPLGSLMTIALFRFAQSLTAFAAHLMWLELQSGQKYNRSGMLTTTTSTSSGSPNDQ